jgi:hypothetical protein
VLAALACLACAVAIIRPLRRIAEHTSYMHTEELAQLVAKLEKRSIGPQINPRM